MGTAWPNRGPETHRQDKRLAPEVMVAAKNIEKTGMLFLTFKERKLK
jgi:hypothetical protein